MKMQAPLTEIFALMVVRLVFENNSLLRARSLGRLAPLPPPSEVTVTFAHMVQR